MPSLNLSALNYLKPPKHYVEQTLSRKIPTFDRRKKSLPVGKLLIYLVPGGGIEPP